MLSASLNKTFLSSLSHSLFVRSVSPDLDDDVHYHHDGSSYGSASPVSHPSLDDDMDCLRTHEMTATSLTATLYTSERCGGAWGDGEQHSSEEELAEINNNGGGAERRTASSLRREGCDSSAGSSDDEVRELFDQQPVSFRASPPHCVHKLVGPAGAAVVTSLSSPAAVAADSSSATRLFLASVSPVAAVAAISSTSRKRHRQASTSDSVSDMEATAVMHRPCLDFEKMQVSKHATFLKCYI